jgi:carbon monoxide dehydrogenase subunit G
MTVTMTGEFELAAPREVVWRKINDPAVLKICVPGCEELTKTSETSFAAVAAIKIGAIKARFKGTMQSDLYPPNSYRISGEGSGGLSGFAKPNA